MKSIESACILVGGFTTDIADSEYIKYGNEAFFACVSFAAGEQE